MKIKGVIKNLKIKRLKSNNSKYISRNFSGAVEGIVGSVQFHIIPCSSLCLFLRSIGPFQCLDNANYRVLICCTCHSQSGSLFVLASSVCKSLQCLISTLTQVGEGGHLFGRTCSVVLWGGRNMENKYHWHVRSARSVWATLGLPLLIVCVLSLSTLLRLQVSLQGNFPKQALGFVPFPGLSCSG